MSNEREFYRASGAMLRRYEDADYAGALQVVDDLARAYPDRVALTDFWRACLLARLEKLDEALDVLTEALDRGLWWAEEQFADPDLDPLRKLPEFAHILAACKKRRQVAEAAVRPGLIIAEPSVPVSGPLPLILALHGRGSTAETDRPEWELACRMGWLVASAQSSQLGLPGAHVWDDHERALRELRTHFDLLGREYALDPARIVLAGFSQGAALTARLASCGALPVAGFIAVAPGNLDVDALALAAQPGRRGYVISGGQDRRHSQHAALAAALTGRGLPCALEVFNELDHEFPPDFETVLSKALSFLFVG